MFFWRPKERKAPAHLKSSPPFLCSGVAGRHPSVKKVLSLEPFCWFLGDADLPQLVTRQGEHLTSGRTFLSLNPKITRVQVVSFNGAGFPRHYHCTRQSPRCISMNLHCNGNSPPRAEGQRWEAQRVAEQCLETDGMMFERSEFLPPQALWQAASGEVWTDWKMSQGDSWTKEAPNAVHDCPVFCYFLTPKSKERKTTVRI